MASLCFLGVTGGRVTWERTQKHPRGAQTVTALGFGTQVWGVQLLTGLTLRASQVLAEKKLFLGTHGMSFLEHYGTDP